MFGELLKNDKIKSTWAWWVATDIGKAARETRDFLSMCFSNVDFQKKPAVIKKLHGDKSQVEATLHELVAHELLRRLKLAPQFEPPVGRQAPDLVFEFKGRLFVADVFVTHSPSKTVKYFSDGTMEAYDSSELGESRAKKIADTIQNKAGEYAEISQPLVLFAFLGDHYALDDGDVERALFGRTVDEAGPEEYFPDAGRSPIPVGGILLPDEDGIMPYRNLSAVVVCDWFDTLNQNDRGKRLFCSVLHHWAPCVPLPVEAFGRFAQVVCDQVMPGAYKPRHTAARNTVAKFVSSQEMQFGLYSPNYPW